GSGSDPDPCRVMGRAASPDAMQFSGSLLDRVPHRVYQRGRDGRASIRISLHSPVPLECMRVRVVAQGGEERQAWSATEVSGRWISHTLAWRAELAWLRYDVEGIVGGQVVATYRSPWWAVGDVFIAAGQSNST